MMENKNIMIYINHFSFSKTAAPFFKDIALSLQQNKLNFIQGKNGVGKSTLFRIIQGNISPHESLRGSLDIDETSYSLSTRSTTPPIFLLPQTYTNVLIEEYSFKENLQCVHMKRFPFLQKLSTITAFPDILEKYGINYDIPITQLSGGQRQILSILMALERAPKLLLLDEPTGALDEENADMVIQFLQEICSERKITMLIIVHAIEIVKKYAHDSYAVLVKDEKGTRTIKMHS